VKKEAITMSASTSYASAQLSIEGHVRCAPIPVAALTVEPHLSRDGCAPHKPPLKEKWRLSSNRSQIMLVDDHALFAASARCCSAIATLRGGQRRPIVEGIKRAINCNPMAVLLERTWPVCRAGVENAAADPARLSRHTAIDHADGL
jgi:hypothetical protein